MSTVIKVTALQQRDLFELPNGSVYETARRGTADDPVQAHLWCAHPPDASTFAPPLIDLQPEHEVSLLSTSESRLHVSHAGYVRKAFEQEMDRHHQESMSVVYEKMNREDAALRQREHEGRPWWKKLFS
jgi:hypothetical protein